MRNVYRKLTKEQKERGVIFSSELIPKAGQMKGFERCVHEVKAEQVDKWEVIERLTDNSFFRNSPFDYNLIRK